jgi:FlaA1/EpsC-like NDP-sugar epimerase
LEKKKIKVSSIRFGNVIGSRGSVIPNFISLLKKEENIVVTNKKMTRFVMTIEDSVNSILMALKNMKSYEIFILKSMKCFKIIDLAKALLFYFKKKGNKLSRVTISKEGKGEKFEEELFQKKDIPKIVIENKMFVIKKKIMNNNIKYINKIKNYRVSNFNFMSRNEIIKMLRNLKILD